ncbi:MAG: SDR family oxidoreductase [Bacteroidia bacterium]
MERITPCSIVTGASSGIGQSLAIELAQKGHHLALMARNATALSDTVAHCESHGVKVVSVIGDVSFPEDCQKLIDSAVSAFGRIDALYNNAGISMRALFTDVDVEVLERVMRINFWGAVYCTKYALPHLLASKGSVIGVSSVAGFKGLPARTGYSASKFAMHGFLESLRIENRHTGLHVLIACPGYTASNIRKTALNAQGDTQKESPLNEKKLMSSEEVAQHIVRAVERRRTHLVLTFQGKMALLINALSSRLADWVAYRVISKEPDSPFH